MDKSVDFDAIIIGGGPAGSCAALRLLNLGHRVALIEQERFPRPQIGESLSPGIRNIFNYLQADELLSSNDYLHNLPAEVIWETQSASSVNAEHRGPGVMVNRGKLDDDMIKLAVKRGLKLFQPSRFESCSKTGDNWLVTLNRENTIATITATFILDARGRKGIRLQDKILTAPATITLYANIPVHTMAHCTLIEATAEGWVWGSPLPGKQFRIMAFLRPEQVRNRALDETWNTITSASLLFKKGLKKTDTSAIQTCSVLNYCHRDPWRDNYIMLGEAAFTLDPLSSTGVEKAMRMSLQAIIAVNTVLRSGDVQMAKYFYEERMIESVSTHLLWTNEYYASAWPKQQHLFWKERSQSRIELKGNKTPFYDQLQAKLTASHQKTNTISTPGIRVNQLLTSLWHEKIKLAPDLTYRKTPCVVNNHLEIKTAIMRPGLPREVAYLEQVEIAPILAMICPAETLGELLFKWSKHMPFEKAKRIAVGLWNFGVIDINSN